jgi:CHAT domain
MTLRWVEVGEMVVLDNPRELTGLLDADSEFSVAALRHGRGWYLFHRADLKALGGDLGADLTPPDLLEDHRQVLELKAVQDREPARPAVVFGAADEVLGAWVHAGRTVSGGGPLRRRLARGVAGGNPPGDDPEGTIARTPHLDAPEEIEKAPRAAFSVAVYADANELREGEAGEGIVLELPAGVDAVDVGVLLQLSDHFEIAAESGSEYASIELSRDAESSERAEFELRVVGDPPGGPAAVSALFTLRGRPCGYVTRTWDWDAPGPRATRVGPDADAPVSMPLHVGAAPASLSVVVTAPIKDGVNFKCAVQAPGVEGFETPSSEDFAISADGYRYVKGLLDGLAAADRTPAERFGALLEAGQAAWEAAPEIFKRALWAMVDAGRPPTTISIASVEPILPWELMIPRRFDGKTPDELLPLGVEFSIGRWTRHDSQAPPPRLPVKNAFVVAPEYDAEHRKLDYEPELKLIAERLRGRRVEPASVAELDRRFGEEHASLLHFVCHGSAGVENDDAIELDDKGSLRARQMETLDGFKALCRAEHPIVFLNACSVGQMVPFLGGGSGFPRSFGNLGAHAIVAPLWPVDNKLAKDVALAVYTAALEPGAPPLASILRDLRRRGYEEEDADTYAAYCFFGDPQARLELVEDA